MLNRVVFADDDEAYSRYYHRESATHYPEQDDAFSLPEASGSTPGSDSDMGATSIVTG
jgi:hypothetical protein